MLLKNKNNNVILNGKQYLKIQKLCKKKTRIYILYNNLHIRIFEYV